MFTEENIQFLKLAIEKSRESFNQGNFPAGAVVVKDGKVLAEAVSSPYPGLFHADSKAVSEAFQKHGPLKGASLYVGLENCLMCLGIAYWGGISDIYFAIPKSAVSGDYYESHEDVSSLAEKFNHPIKLHHVVELQDEAIQVIREWEIKNKLN